MSALFRVIHFCPRSSTYMNIIRTTHLWPPSKFDQSSTCLCSVGFYRTHVQIKHVAVFSWWAEWFHLISRWQCRQFDIADQRVRYCSNFEHSDCISDRHLILSSNWLWSRILPDVFSSSYRNCPLFFSIVLIPLCLRLQGVHVFDSPIANFILLTLIHNCHEWYHQPHRSTTPSLHCHSVYHIPICWALLDCVSCVYAAFLSSCHSWRCHPRSKILCRTSVPRRDDPPVLSTVFRHCTTYRILLNYPRTLGISNFLASSTSTLSEFSLLTSVTTLVEFFVLLILVQVCPSVAEVLEFFFDNRDHLGIFNFCHTSRCSWNFQIASYCPYSKRSWFFFLNSPWVQE